MDVAGVEEAPCDLSIDTFSEKSLDIVVFFQVIKFQNSYMIWIGDDEAKFSDLSIAFKSLVIISYIRCRMTYHKILTQLTTD
jgi:hypothetical protein